MASTISAQPHVTNSTATGNGNNTGIYTQSGTTNISNYTATGNGYAISNFSTTNLNSGTLSGNSYAGIFNNRGSTLNVNNSLIVGNTTAIQGTISSGTYNITTGTPAAAGLQTDANGNAVLAENGGPTATIALTTRGTAVNAGNTTLKTDQRGVARPIGSAPDIGAYESKFMALAPATNLRATAINAAISLTWTDNADGEMGYEIERSTDNKTFTQIFKGTQPNQIRYLDTTAQFGVTYIYRVRPYSSSVPEVSPYSNLARATVTDKSLATPTNLTGKLSADKKSVALSWTDNATGEDGTKVYRRTGNGDFTLIYKGAKPNQTTYTDATIQPGMVYQYHVNVYVTSKGNSADSNIYILRTPADTSLAPATNLTATASGSGISLSWKDNATAEAGYIVERRASSEQNFSEIFRGTTVNQIRYLDTKVVAGTQYEYRVRPYQGTTPGEPSGVAVATAGGTTNLKSSQAPSGGNS